MKIEQVDIKEILPKDAALAPEINWGEEFLEWDKDQQNRYLKKVCNALNHATDRIQKERNELLEKMQVMLTNLENADNGVAIQKAIVLKAITDHNAEKQELISRIRELEVELKLLQDEKKEG